MTKVVPTVVQYGDITVNHGVQIDCSDDGKTLWVNVDGVCAVRLCAGPFSNQLEIELRNIHNVRPL